MSRRQLTGAELAVLTPFTCLLVYLLLESVTTSNSKVPIVATAALYTLMSFRHKFGEIRRVLKENRRFISQDVEGSAFSALPGPSQTELLHALLSLRDYTKNSKQINERRKRLFKLMSWRQQKLCTDVGYLEKLKSIDAGIDRNQTVFDQVAKSVKKKYQVTFKDMDAMDKRSQSNSSLNYRVVESLGHFIRDWACYKDGESEISPLVRYIKDQLDTVIPEEEIKDTCVVIPGSGLGRVAHEIATHKPYGSVQAVEFSGLMHACNEFIYLDGTEVELSPYVHTNLNFVDTKAQFRRIKVPVGVQKPANLTLSLDDFRYCTIPEYKNVVVVSVFFIDTAENIMDYFDRISYLAKPKTGKNGYWINYGPLKYGSAAQAELNAEEILALRKVLGWKDLHYINTIEHPETKYSENGVSGYITDKSSMWQGYYGISMWSSAHEKNQRRSEPRSAAKGRL